MCKVLNLVQKREEKRKSLSSYDEFELQYKEFYISFEYEQWIKACKEEGELSVKSSNANR